MSIDIAELKIVVDADVKDAVDNLGELLSVFNELPDAAKKSTSAMSSAIGTISRIGDVKKPTKEARDSIEGLSDAIKSLTSHNIGNVGKIASELADITGRAAQARKELDNLKKSADDVERAKLDSVSKSLQGISDDAKDASRAAESLAEGIQAVGKAANSARDAAKALEDVNDAAESAGRSSLSARDSFLAVSAGIRAASMSASELGKTIQVAVGEIGRSRSLGEAWEKFSFSVGIAKEQIMGVGTALKSGFAPILEAVGSRILNFNNNIQNSGLFLGRFTENLKNVSSNLGKLNFMNVMRFFEEFQQGFQGIIFAFKNFGRMLGTDIAIEMEQIRASMQATTKSFSTTEKQLADLRTEADKTPFTFREMAQAANMLQSTVKMTGTPMLELVRLSEQLAASHPEQGLVGAAYAIREAATGDMTSAIERFDLARSTINKFKDQGASGLQAIGGAMKEMGIDMGLVSNLATTTTGRISTLTDAFDSIRIKIGKPILESFKNELMAFSNYLDKNSASLQLWAQNLGAQLGRGIHAAVDLFKELGPAVDTTGQTIMSLTNVLGTVIKIVNILPGPVKTAAAALIAFSVAITQVGRTASLLGAVGSQWKAILVIGVAFASMTSGLAMPVKVLTAGVLALGSAFLVLKMAINPVVGAMGIISAAFVLFGSKAKEAVVANKDFWQSVDEGIARNQPLLKKVSDSFYDWFSKVESGAKNTKDIADAMTVYYTQHMKAGQAAQSTVESFNKTTDSLKKKLMDIANVSTIRFTIQPGEINKIVDNLEALQGKLNKLKERLANKDYSGNADKEQIQKAIGILEELVTSQTKVANSTDAMNTEFKAAGLASEQLERMGLKLITNAKGEYEVIAKSADAWKDYNVQVEYAGFTVNTVAKIVTEFGQKFKDPIEKVRNLKEALSELRKETSQEMFLDAQQKSLKAMENIFELANQGIHLKFDAGEATNGVMKLDYGITKLGESVDTSQKSFSQLAAGANAFGGNIQGTVSMLEKLRDASGLTGKDLDFVNQIIGKMAKGLPLSSGEIQVFSETLNTASEKAGKAQNAYGSVFEAMSAMALATEGMHRDFGPLLQDLKTLVEQLVLSAGLVPKTMPQIRDGFKEVSKGLVNIDLDKAGYDGVMAWVRGMSKAYPQAKINLINTADDLNGIVAGKIGDLNKITQGELDKAPGIVAAAMKKVGDAIIIEWTDPELQKSAAAQGIATSRAYLEGLAKEMGAKEVYISNATDRTFQKVLDTSRKVLGIESPSWIAAEYADYFLEGFNKGVDGGEGDMSKNLVAAFQMAMQTLPDEVKKSLDTVQATFAASIPDMATTVSTKFTEFVNLIQQAFTRDIGNLSSLENIFKDTINAIFKIDDPLEETTRKLVSAMDRMSETLHDRMGKVGQGLSDGFNKNIDGVSSGIKRELTAAAGSIDKFIQGINKVLSRLKVKSVPEIGDLGITDTPATGGNPAVYATGGTINRPHLAMIGEDAPRHPEYIIPTNPAYRSRAVSLWADAGKKLGIGGFAQGGITQVEQVFGKGGIDQADARTIGQGDAAQSSIMNMIARGARPIVEDIARSTLNGIKDSNIGGEIGRKSAQQVQKAAIATVQQALNDAKRALAAGAGGRWLNPAPGFPVTQEFGMTSFAKDGNYGGGQHTGTDLGTPTGTAIHAAESGEVIGAGTNGGYGIAVMLQHNNKVMSLYGHLQETLVKVGDLIATGETIARSDNTGHSTGPHLHFEVREDGTPVNPRNYVNFEGGNKGIPMAPAEVQAAMAKAMGITGVPPEWLSGLMIIANGESNFSPTAINPQSVISNGVNYGNATGIMQTLPSTFRAYALPGYNDIMNPLHNIIAAIRYIQARYGDISNVPGVRSWRAGQGYRPYARGGMINEPVVGRGVHSGSLYSFGEKGPELVLPNNIVNLMNRGGGIRGGRNLGNGILGFDGGGVFPGITYPSPRPTYPGAPGYVGAVSGGIAPAPFTPDPAIQRLSDEIARDELALRNFERDHRRIDGSWDDPNNAVKYKDMSDQINIKRRTLADLQQRDQVRENASRPATRSQAETNAQAIAGYRATSALGRRYGETIGSASESFMSAIQSGDISGALSNITSIEQGLRSKNIDQKAIEAYVERLIQALTKAVNEKTPEAIAAVQALLEEIGKVLGEDPLGKFEQAVKRGREFENMKKYFGEEGANIAQALLDSIAGKGTEEQAGSMINELIVKLKDMGFPKWEEMGNKLIETFGKAIAEGTPEAIDAALKALQSVTDMTQGAIKVEFAGIWDAIQGTATQAFQSMTAAADAIAKIREIGGINKADIENLRATINAIGIVIRDALVEFNTNMIDGLRAVNVASQNATLVFQAMSAMYDTLKKMRDEGVVTSQDAIDFERVISLITSILLKAVGQAKPDWVRMLGYVEAEFKVASDVFETLNKVYDLVVKLRELDTKIDANDAEQIGATLGLAVSALAQAISTMNSRLTDSSISVVYTTQIITKLFETLNTVVGYLANFRTNIMKVTARDFDRIGDTISYAIDALVKAGESITSKVEAAQKKLKDTPEKLKVLFDSLNTVGQFLGSIRMLPFPASVETFMNELIDSSLRVMTYFVNHAPKLDATARKVLETSLPAIKGVTDAVKGIMDLYMMFVSTTTEKSSRNSEQTKVMMDGVANMSSSFGEATEKISTSFDLADKFEAARPKIEAAINAAVDFTRSILDRWSAVWANFDVEGHAEAFKMADHVRSVTAAIKDVFSLFSDLGNTGDLDPTAAFQQYAQDLQDLNESFKNEMEDIDQSIADAIHNAAGVTDPAQAEQGINAAYAAREKAQRRYEQARLKLERKYQQDQIKLQKQLSGGSIEERIKRGIGIMGNTFDAVMTALMDVVNKFGKKLEENQGPLNTVFGMLSNVVNTVQSLMNTLEKMGNDSEGKATKIRAMIGTFPGIFEDLGGVIDTILRMPYDTDMGTKFIALTGMMNSINSMIAGMIGTKAEDVEAVKTLVSYYPGMVTDIISALTSITSVENLGDGEKSVESFVKIATAINGIFSIIASVVKDVKPEDVPVFAQLIGTVPSIITDILNAMAKTQEITKDIDIAAIMADILKILGTATEFAMKSKDLFATIKDAAALSGTFKSDIDDWTNALIAGLAELVTQADAAKLAADDAFTHLHQALLSCQAALQECLKLKQCQDNLATCTGTAADGALIVPTDTQLAQSGMIALANGGIMWNLPGNTDSIPGIAPGRPAAEGRIVRGPQKAIIGEAGAEAVLPLTRPRQFWNLMVTMARNGLIPSPTQGDRLAVQRANLANIAAGSILSGTTSQGSTNIVGRTASRAGGCTSCQKAAQGMISIVNGGIAWTKEAKGKAFPVTKDQYGFSYVYAEVNGQWQYVPESYYDAVVDGNSMSGPKIISGPTASFAAIPAITHLMANGGIVGGGFSGSPGGVTQPIPLGRPFPWTKEAKGKAFIPTKDQYGNPYVYVEVNGQWQYIPEAYYDSMVELNAGNSGYGSFAQNIIGMTGGAVSAGKGLSSMAASTIGDKPSGLPAAATVFHSGLAQDDKSVYTGNILPINTGEKHNDTNGQIPFTDPGTLIWNTNPATNASNLGEGVFNLYDMVLQGRGRSSGANFVDYASYLPGDSASAPGVGPVEKGIDGPFQPGPVVIEKLIVNNYQPNQSARDLSRKVSRTLKDRLSQV